ncbi:MAG: symmetrical bis(5'-nucleosyl)-tetraphosphatase [Planctomycetes bacterium]|nr:symmetrical bis(5'-nucleosyl)-tetraphosphatase [Planctomycetota bacterium]
MATYAIGDVQGCWRTLQRLVARVGFDPAQDRLWFAGDLVNRGPDSLSVLRYVRGLGDGARVVLGNHDLHLLAIAAGVRKPKGRDTVEGVLAAPDRDALLEWLRQQPLLLREGAWVMFHAGLPPSWSLEQAEARAREAEAWLRGPRLGQLLAAFASKGKRRPGEVELERVCETLSALTLLRTCTLAGEMALAYAGPPEAAPAGLVAWHAARALDPQLTLVCGHWAAQGLVQRPGLLALDSGCVWGNALTAARLEDGAVWQEPSAER